MRQIEFSTEEFAKALQIARAKWENDLLVKAQANDEEAATELLYFFTDVDSMASDIVKEAIIEGMARDLKRRLDAFGVPGKNAPTWRPLAIFNQRFEDEKRSRGRKSKDAAKVDAKLLTRAIFNHGLTMDEVQIALTTNYKGLRYEEFKNKAIIVPRENWPKNIGEAKTKLIEFVCHVFDDASVDACSEYVRRSFPGIDWASSREPFPYPDNW